MKKLLLLSLMALAIQSQAQNVGIGTPTPAAKLEVVGSGNAAASNTFLLKNSSANTLLKMQDDGRLFVGLPSVADGLPYRFRVESGDKGSLFIENPINAANATVRILRGYPESETTYTTALQVRASSDWATDIKGYGGVLGESTFNLRPGGEFIAAPTGPALHSIGKLIVSENNTTPATGALLEVDGTAKINGEVNRPSTGAANMVPVAYGVINGLGAIESGSGNFSVSLILNTFFIHINGETDHQTYTCSAIATGTSPKFISLEPGIANIEVKTFTFSGTQAPSRFHFIAYKP